MTGFLFLFMQSPLFLSADYRLLDIEAYAFTAFL